MKDLTSTSFGYIIAFVLPGMLGLSALALWISDVNILLKSSFSPETTIGPSFFLLFCALTVGLMISAIRFFIFERWLCRKHRFAKSMFKELRKDGNLAAFTAAVEQHYRYHQFYGGCSIALLVLFPRWIWNNWSKCHPFIGGFTIVIFVIFQSILIESARNTFINYIERGKEIVEG